jgi:hypothetical protein
LQHSNGDASKVVDETADGTEVDANATTDENDEEKAEGADENDAEAVAEGK